MFRNDSGRSSTSDVELDLYFLIARFLSSGPCRAAAKILIKELEDNRLLHCHVDWKGDDRKLEYNNSIRRFSSIAPDHLLQLCQRIVPLLDEVMPPPMLARSSLLGAGRYSVLRTKENVQKTIWNPRCFAATIGRNPVITPHNFANHNLALPIFGRELGGSKQVSLMRPIKTIYGKMKLHRRILGHLSSVYCVLFDRTGARIFTGSDDCLIKCWSSVNGRLLSTFRGHHSEICDMDVSYGNVILASASCDKEIRIWDIRSGTPITILNGHNAMITSVEFSPLVQGDIRYLVSTGRDGNVCFWVWNAASLEFESSPHKFQERNCPGVAMLCSSWSSGGRFIAVGGSDNLVHIYHIPLEPGTMVYEPRSIAEQSEHTEAVDSLSFAHDGLRFISGSKDGTARIWIFKHSIWTSSVLDVSLSDGKEENNTTSTNSSEQRSSITTRSQTNASLTKVRVIMVAWDCCNENVMTSLTDFSIKVWNSTNQKLVSVLRGHTDEAYCLDPHPTEKKIFLSAGHDGNVFMWNVMQGSIILKFHNMLEGQGHGAVFDAKFSRDGTLVSCTDSHGHLLLFGFGDGSEFEKMPEQQFFHTDYRPLIRDQQGYVLDEQTQQAPHLMPPPFIVDVEGNPYPPEMQRLVPGRERCSNTQLIPSLITGENGLPEVLPINEENERVEADELPATEMREAANVLNQLINQMQQGDEPTEEIPLPLASPRSAPVGLLREGDVVGVRQMHSNAPRSQLASAADIMALTQRVITPQFSREESLNRIEERKSKGRFELTWYRTERRTQKKVATSIEIETNETDRTRRSRRTYYSSVTEEDDISDFTVRSTRRSRADLAEHVRAHRYSTRSTAPRRRGLIPTGERLSSLTENGLSLDRVPEESDSSSNTAESTSASSSNEDHLSEDQAILRRSRRKKRSMKNKEDTSNDEDSSESSGEDSEVSAESLDRTASSFSSGIARRKSARQKRDGRLTLNRKSRRISSTTSWRPDYDSAESSPERKTRKVRVIKSETSSSNEEQPSTSAKCQIKKTTSQTPRKRKSILMKKKPVKRVPFQIVPGQPPPPMFMTPDWIKRVTPCHTPFVPQIGDELVYLPQGHACYVRKIVAENVWDIEEDEVYYAKHPEVSAAEYCRVIRIAYHIGPPTLCEVLLRPTKRKVVKNKNPYDFHIKYHDMDNVVDFLVLKQKYEKSIARSWKPNDRFRSIIDDVWWYGQIVEHKVFETAYPESKFQCFSVIWDSETSQVDYLSPWDMEPIPDNILQDLSPVVTRSRNANDNPRSPSEQAPLDSEELRNAIAYIPKPDDWGNPNIEDSSDSSNEDTQRRERNMDAECQRIKAGLDELVLRDLYPEFSRPVDVIAYPTYPLYVAYPTDLSTMSKRLENKFYRRSLSLCWEISCLKQNACAFNEPETDIVKRAKFLCRLLTNFVRTSDCTNILRLERILKKQNPNSSDLYSSSADEDSQEVPNSLKKSNKANGRFCALHSSEDQINEISSPDEEEVEEVIPWDDECKKLLGEVMLMEDSRPFRSIDSEIEDGDSMDLTSVRGKLTSDRYSDPTAFREDIQRIFVNCKKHNTVREMHSKSIRLSALMNARIEGIVQKWHNSVASEKQPENRINLRRSGRNRKYLRSNLNDSIVFKAESSDENSELGWRKTKNSRNCNTTAHANNLVHRDLRSRRKPPVKIESGERNRGNEVIPISRNRQNSPSEISADERNRRSGDESDASENSVYTAKRTSNARKRRSYLGLRSRQTSHSEIDEQNQQSGEDSDASVHSAYITSRIVRRRVEAGDKSNVSEKSKTSTSEMSSSSEDETTLQTKPKRNSERGRRSNAISKRRRSRSDSDKDRLSEESPIFGRRISKRRKISELNRSRYVNTATSQIQSTNHRDDSSDCGSQDANSSDEEVGSDISDDDDDDDGREEGTDDDEDPDYDSGAKKRSRKAHRNGQTKKKTSQFRHARVPTFSKGHLRSNVQRPARFASDHDEDNNQPSGSNISSRGRKRKLSYKAKEAVC